MPIILGAEERVTLRQTARRCLGGPRNLETPEGPEPESRVGEGVGRQTGSAPRAPRGGLGPSPPLDLGCLRGPSPAGSAGHPGHRGSQRGVGTSFLPDGPLCSPLALTRQTAPEASRWDCRPSLVGSWGRRGFWGRWGATVRLGWGGAGAA